MFGFVRSDIALASGGVCQELLDRTHVRLVFRPFDADLGSVGRLESAYRLRGGILVSRLFSNAIFKHQPQKVAGRELPEYLDLLADIVQVASRGVDEPDMVVRVGVQVLDEIVCLERHGGELRDYLPVALLIRRHDPVEEAIRRLPGGHA